MHVQAWLNKLVQMRGFRSDGCLVVYENAFFVLFDYVGC